MSIFALQGASASGVRVIITSTSEKRWKHARPLGRPSSWPPVGPDWDAEVHGGTDSHGADLMIETEGAATFPRCRRPPSAAPGS